MWSQWVDKAAETARSLGQQAYSGARDAIESVSLDRLREERDEEFGADLQVTYVADRVLMGGFPGDAATKLGEFLRRRHGDSFMVWNLSEESYDYDALGGQVLEYRFPGLPAPPLGMIFKIVTSIQSWLEADPRNVALVHCFTGKGRSATILACLLAWLGEAESPTQALLEIGRLRGVDVPRLTIPSQRRYVQCFSSMLDGSRPRLRPLVLRRVILNAVPALDRDEVLGEGCRPFLQLFRAGRLVYSSLWRDAEEGKGIRFVPRDDGSVKFAVDAPLLGDVLLRCRHVGRDRRRVSMFRAAFHTGFVHDGLLRFPRGQLDGAAEDARFSPDFFVELIFSELGEGGDAGVHPRGQQGAAQADAESGALDAFLSSESDFWRQVARRRRALEARQARAANEAAAAAAPSGGAGAVRDRERGSATSAQAAAAHLGPSFAIDEEDAVASAAVSSRPPPPSSQRESGDDGVGDGDGDDAGAGADDALDEFALLESELGLGSDTAHLVCTTDSEGSEDWAAGEGEEGADGGGEADDDDDAFLAALDQEMADLGIDGAEDT